MIPKTMRAIEITGPGGPDVLRPATRDLPVLKPGELLIRVQAAGVNRPDVLQRLGAYAPPPGASDLPGLEVAGNVEAGDLDSSGWSDRRSSVCTRRRRRVRRMVCRAVWPVPAGAAPVEFVEARAARDVFHGLEQRVRSGGAGTRRDATGPGRYQRNRRNGDPAGGGAGAHRITRPRARTERRELARRSVRAAESTIAARISPR